MRLNLRASQTTKVMLLPHPNIFVMDEFIYSYELSWTWIYIDTYLLICYIFIYTYLLHTYENYGNISLVLFHEKWSLPVA